MKKILFPVLLLLFLSACDFSDYILKQDLTFTTVFEESGGTETATYQQIIDFYQDLAAVYPSIELQSIGETDSGKPLHLAIFNPDKDFDLESARADKTVILINNGIHPGESDGIDATMMLFRDLAQDSVKVPENTIIAAIPVYNVGGALNRNSFTRTNQNGPKAYGFRGNARNYDLNRDFIKADTKNTRTFYEIFHEVDPDVFIDTHVSNGADYQYTLTHLFTQHDQMGGELGSYIKNQLRPGLEKALKAKDNEMTPYVNVFNDVPEKGFTQFLDTPRYSTGYTSLWNTVGMMIETHMLKPYDKRVWGTYETLLSMIEIADKDSKLIRNLRTQAFQTFPEQKSYAFDFKPDSSQVSSLQFKGYEAERIESEVTGAMRLKYDTTRPFTKKVDYYDTFKAQRQVTMPKGYIIPRGWWPILQLLELNEVVMEEFDKDTMITAQVYRIKNFKTRSRAYEGHYMHSETKVTQGIQKVRIRRGDVFVPLKQKAAKYLMATLEPEAPDSFFNWNFFDSVLQQKEGFSPYVFEDIAREFLDDYPKIEEEFLQKKQNDPEFAQNWYAQLEWIHRKSEHYEKSHLRYPIFRINR
ncbi:Zinc carboxypeptidase [Salinimicrobium catena]|uniref:Zinc carboxypeptidase n=1 Tax=Salinimicrobium catena TaxID=390640 RepID=A0A1H5NMY8_9FLAO|nr:M14 family metallopeptidase [Salinimicrobium catena]SDL56590.1 Zinc carboxypeptidase [Salinimicrobium catena]SEF02955.1 Zinc carboxypeptidase [Salinimicrobium catena]